MTTNWPALWKRAATKLHREARASEGVVDDLMRELFAAEQGWAGALAERDRLLAECAAWRAEVRALRKDGREGRDDK